MTIKGEPELAAGQTFTIEGELPTLNGRHRNNYTAAEKEQIARAYENNRGMKNGWLAALAAEMGRDPGNISRYARRVGLSDAHRYMHPPEERFLARTCTACGKTFAATRHSPRKTCSDECSNARQVEARGRPKWTSGNHPRGFLGHTHPPDFCLAQSRRAKALWADPNSKLNSEAHRAAQSQSQSKRMAERIKMNPSSVYSRTQKGWLSFEDGKKRNYYRSGWEMNFACYLAWLKQKGEIIEWWFEPDTFWFENIKRGVRSYLPDFKVQEQDNSILYYEVKGWMDSKSRTKLDRMARYYPDVRLIVIDEPQYKAIMKYRALFVGMADSPREEGTLDE